MSIDSERKSKREALENILFNNAVHDDCVQEGIWNLGVFDSYHEENTLCQHLVSFGLTNEQAIKIALELTSHHYSVKANSQKRDIAQSFDELCVEEIEVLCKQAQRIGDDLAGEKKELAIFCGPSGSGSTTMFHHLQGVKLDRVFHSTSQRYVFDFARDADRCLHKDHAIGHHLAKRETTRFHCRELSSALAVSVHDAMVRFANKDDAMKSLLLVDGPATPNTSESNTVREFIDAAVLSRLMQRASTVCFILTLSLDAITMMRGSKLLDNIIEIIQPILAVTKDEELCFNSILTLVRPYPVGELPADDTIGELLKKVRDSIPQPPLEANGSASARFVAHLRNEFAKSFEMCPQAFIAHPAVPPDQYYHLLTKSVVPLPAGHLVKLTGLLDPSTHEALLQHFARLANTAVKALSELHEQDFTCCIDRVRRLCSSLEVVFGEGSFNSSVEAFWQGCEQVWRSELDGTHKLLFPLREALDSHSAARRTSFADSCARLSSIMCLVRKGCSVLRCNRGENLEWVEEFLSKSLADELLRLLRCEGRLSSQWLAACEAIEDLAQRNGLSLKACANVTVQIREEVKSIRTRWLSQLQSKEFDGTQFTSDMKQLLDTAELSTALDVRCGEGTAERVKELGAEKAKSFLEIAFTNVSNGAASDKDLALIEFLHGAEARFFFARKDWDDTARTLLSTLHLGLQQNERMRLLHFLLRYDDTRVYHHLLREVGCEQARALQRLLAKCWRIARVEEAYEIRADCEELLENFWGNEEGKLLSRWVELCTLQTIGSKLSSLLAVLYVLSQMRKCCCEKSELRQLVDARHLELSNSAERYRQEISDTVAAASQLPGLAESVSHLPKCSSMHQTALWLHAFNDNSSDTSSELSDIETWFLCLHDDLLSASIGFREARCMVEVALHPQWNDQAKTVVGNCCRRISKKIMIFAESLADELLSALALENHDEVIRLFDGIRLAFYPDETTTYATCWSDDHKDRLWDVVIRNMEARRREYVHNTFRTLHQRCGALSSLVGLDQAARRLSFLRRENGFMFESVSSILSKTVATARANLPRVIDTRLSVQPFEEVLSVVAPLRDFLSADAVRLCDEVECLHNEWNETFGTRLNDFEESLLASIVEVGSVDDASWPRELRGGFAISRMNTVRKVLHHLTEMGMPPCPGNWLAWSSILRYAAFFNERSWIGVKQSFRAHSIQTPGDVPDLVENAIREVVQPFVEKWLLHVQPRNETCYHLLEQLAVESLIDAAGCARDWMIDELARCLEEEFEMSDLHAKLIFLLACFDAAPERITLQIAALAQAVAGNI